MIKYDLDDLKHLQQLELRILKEIMSICDAHDLKYYAYGGTALGAIRHEGFIPWDNDIDIAMFRDDYEKLLKILELELSDEYYVIHFCNREDCYFSIARVYLKGTKFLPPSPLDVSFEEGIKVDIFPLDNVPKSKIKRMYYHYKLDFYNHIIWNSLFEVGARNKLFAGIHFLLHRTLKFVPMKSIKKRYMRFQTKYNNKTNYVTVHESQVDFLNFGKYGYFDKRDFEPSKKFKFEDTEINVFNNYDKILTIYYGDYMTLPPEDERYVYMHNFDFGEY